MKRANELLICLTFKNGLTFHRQDFLIKTKSFEKNASFLIKKSKGQTVLYKQLTSKVSPRGSGSQIFVSLLRGHHVSITEKLSI